MEITKELRRYMSGFYKEFGDVVPLRELPASATTEEVINAIKLSLEAHENLLPKIFGYEELEKDPSILF